MRYETRDLGDGAKRQAVYDMPVANPNDYWQSVTDVPCPICPDGAIRWNEAGYVPGSRICDTCGRFFQAGGDSSTPTLIRDSRFDDRSVIDGRVRVGAAPGRVVSWLDMETAGGSPARTARSTGAGGIRTPRCDLDCMNAAELREFDRMGSRTGRWAFACRLFPMRPLHFVEVSITPQQYGPA
jgi:hypothetical protein